MSAIGSFPIDLPLNSTREPSFVLARAVDVDNPSDPSQVAVTFPDWVTVTSAGKKFVRVRRLGGLLAGHVYDLSFAVF